MVAGSSPRWLRCMTNRGSPSLIARADNLAGLYWWLVLPRRLGVRAAAAWVVAIVVGVVTVVVVDSLAVALSSSLVRSEGYPWLRVLESALPVGRSGRGAGDRVTALKRSEDS